MMKERTLELALPQRWRIAGDDDEFRLAGAQRLEGGLVAERHFPGLCECYSLCVLL